MKNLIQKHVTQTWLAIVALSLLTIVITSCSSTMLSSNEIDSNNNFSLAKRNEGLVYFLPKGLIEVKGILNTNTTGPLANHYTFTINPVIEPDYSNIFLLNPHDSMFSHDVYSFNVTNGLLSSINSSNSDQSGAIVIKIAETAGVIVAKGGGAVILDIKSQNPLIRPNYFDFFIDPNKSENDSNSCSNISKQLSSFKLSLSIPQLENGIYTNGKFAQGSASSNINYKGIFYRCKVPYVVQLTDTLSNDVASATVMIPAENPIFSYIPKRHALITTTTGLTFQDGSLTAVNFDKPSTALAWVSLPLDAVKAFLSAPAELLQIKLNYANTNAALTSADNTVLFNELSDLKSKVALLQFQQTNNIH